MADQAKEFSWKNAAGLKIAAIHWPKTDAKAVIGIIHGIGEHARRYDHLAGFFQDQGFACLGFDREGHGKSEGKRGHASNYKLFVDEVARLVQECRGHYPGSPVFLYGHSMGGQVLLRYLIRRNPNIAGAIVSAPHIRLPFKPSSVQVGLGKLMRRLKPDFTQGTPLNLDLLSRDRNVRAKYEADPLVHNKVSAQIGIDLLENARSIDGWQGNLGLPTLLMHGTMDGITDFGASKDFAERNPNKLTFKAWDEFYHELHNEPEWRAVAAFVVGWIEQGGGFQIRP